MRRSSDINDSDEARLAAEGKWVPLVHGRLLRHSKRKAGLKVPQCAAAWGVGLDTWRSWESGKYAPSAAMNRATLLRFLQMSASHAGCWLLRRVVGQDLEERGSNFPFDTAVCLFEKPIPPVDNSWALYISIVYRKHYGAVKVAGFQSFEAFMAFAERWRDPQYIAATLGLPDRGEGAIREPSRWSEPDPRLPPRVIGDRAN